MLCSGLGVTNLSSSTNRFDRLNSLQEYKSFIKQGPNPLDKDELNHDWSHEVSWRLNRAYELKVSRNSDARNPLRTKSKTYFPNHKMSNSVLRKFVASLFHRYWNVCKTDLLKDEAKSCYQKQHSPVVFQRMQNLRFKIITYQHRMHSEISTFSRKEFYKNSALIDANTIADRNRDLSV